MKHIHVFMSVLLSIAILGALGVNSAQTAQAQIADACFDHVLSIGSIAGHLCLPLTLIVSLPSMFVPIGSSISPILDMLSEFLAPIVSMFGAIPIFGDLVVLAIVFAFGVLDTQKIAALSDSLESLIVSTELALVRLIP